MAYRSIVVRLDTSEHAHPRLELALSLARRFDAHLTGMYSFFTPDPRLLFVMAGSADYYESHEPLRAERRAALERLFHAELSRANVSGEWIAVDQYPHHTVPNLGRCADLIVAGQDDPNDPEAYAGDHFTENLVMSVGLPVLLVPYTGEHASPGQHIMVAWDGSREATRAAHDALPFMHHAARTTIVTVNGTKNHPFRNRVSGADIAAVIARHGVNVEVAVIEAGAGTSTGDALLSKVADIGADLLVMGAYGHARWHELIMGGTTRTILSSMTVPVLMSH
jgi:nucleotide-binding universal stress UspA family protein